MKTIVLVAALILIAAPFQELAADDVSFSRDVRPILADRCFHCHGPDADNQDSDFRLDSEANAKVDLGGYFGIVGGDLDASELHLRIHSDDDDQMPPADSVRQLSDKEKKILDRWIQAGAHFEGHWSFRPLPAVVPVPAKTKWDLNSIDPFVRKRMEQGGLRPNIAAPPETWLRRVTFDLTGLPPTLKEIDNFLNDPSPRAHDTVVDRLLASDACAERLTAEWLDVARYSDTYGFQTDHGRFIWPYRDWVIKAFQRNLPYDEFITEQLAGDLLPGATQDQRLATAFNRLHSHKKEGGSSAEEFRVENVADRTQTFAAAFLGLTLECARCHDHKYDPITTKEYYQLSAYFANVDENGLISFFTDAAPTPAMSLMNDAQRKKLAAAQTKVEEAERELKRTIAEADSRFDAWLQDLSVVKIDKSMTARLTFDELKDNVLINHANESAPAKTGGKNRLTEGKHGNAILLTGDDPVDLPGIGRFRRDQAFSIALWIRPADIEERGVIYRHSRGWDDAGSIGYELTKLGDRLSAKLVHFWPGDAICVETGAELRANEWIHVGVTYDGSSRADGLQIFLNGTPAKTTIVKDNLTRQITKWGGGFNDLAIGSRYRDRGFKNGAVDDFVVFERQIAAIEIAQLFDQHSLDDLLSRADGERSAEDLTTLKELFRLNGDPKIAESRQALLEARHQWSQVIDSIPEITVMRERNEPSTAYVLQRGAYDQRAESVLAGTPAVLPALPTGQPNNRLALAAWLTEPSHPLTARVAVNRYWQTLFGNGLVRTPEDFGMQGQPPTHPELLDWLARDFVDHHWDLKRLLKQMVLSATYRQHSVVAADVRQRDPANLFWARGPGKRLTAEMIRDNALATSGLLVPTIGGASVRPYDLSAAFKPSAPSKGDGLYRRSLYTYWQRTAPTPVMMTMNASKREVCRLRRDETDSPLQAFVLLNGTQFVEAARVFAGEQLKQHGDDVGELVADSFRKLIGRPPSKRESTILLALFEEQRTHFENELEMAKQLLSTGDSPQNGESDTAQHAAATILINSILNLDESVRLR